MKFLKERLLPYYVIITAALLVIGGYAMFKTDGSVVLQIIFTVIFVFLVVVILQFYYSKYQEFPEWAMRNNFQFFRHGKINEIKARFQANPGKNFFGARVLQFYSQFKKPNLAQGPFAEGAVSGRHIWVYPIVGSMFIGTILSANSFRGWCMEISTKRVPVKVLVGRKFLESADKMHTESRQFEKLYDLTVKREGQVLQLLDPGMLELIANSNITALEFSDQSVVLYHTIFPPLEKKLDAYLKHGLKIAEQADRNFPLNK